MMVNDDEDENEDEVNDNRIQLDQIQACVNFSEEEYKRSNQ